MPFNAIIYLIVELLVVQIILPSIAAVALLSKEQGRSWFRWMLLSLLITPFLSLLLLLLFSKIQNSKIDNHSDNTAMVCFAGGRTEQDALKWFAHYAGLSEEIEISQRLFLYLLDELIDLFYALVAVLLWRKYVHDLVKRVTKVAELSAHNEYCSYRLRVV